MRINKLLVMVVLVTLAPVASNAWSAHPNVEIVELRCGSGGDPLAWTVLTDSRSPGAPPTLVPPTPPASPTLNCATAMAALRNDHFVLLRVLGAPGGGVLHIFERCIYPGGKPC